MVVKAKEPLLELSEIFIPSTCIVFLIASSSYSIIIQ